MNNMLIIAVAGSGKTTYLINEALNKKDNILITTYTKSNENEIKNKFYSKIGYIPSNIEIMTWYEFLLRHGVRPYQGAMNDLLYEKNIGFFLTPQKSTQYVKKEDILKYYFTRDMKIFSDKVSFFILTCNEKIDGKIISRISKIYSHIFIDEVQDLVGYDLDILRLLINSNTELIMVGDPRQTTYTTHPTEKYTKYQNGKIEEFIKYEVNKKHELCQINFNILKQSHRNNSYICSFSSKLYPDLPVSEPCQCASCRDYEQNHIGVFLVHKKDVINYLLLYSPVQLRWNSKRICNTNYTVFNFGESKGLAFDRVIIYPTKDMEQWISNRSYILAGETKAKFYVAITRARKSVAIVVDDNMIEKSQNNDFSFYIPIKRR